MARLESEQKKYSRVMNCVKNSELKIDEIQLECIRKLFPEEETENKESSLQEKARKHKRKMKQAGCLLCGKVCEGATLKKCSICKAHYCSKKCQDQNWSEHKTLCNMFARLKKKTEDNLKPLEFAQQK